MHPPGFGVGLTVPHTFFGMRALSLLLRIGTSPQPVRLSYIAAPGASEDEIRAAFTDPVSRLERRAPGVFDADVPTDRLETFLMEHHRLFRRVDAPGWLHGEPIERPDDRAEIAIAVDEPATIERKRALGNLGFRMVGESEGEIRGVILGKDVAELLAAPWIGPVEVRKVHPPRT